MNGTILQEGLKQIRICEVNEMRRRLIRPNSHSNGYEYAFVLRHNTNQIYASISNTALDGLCLFYLVVIY